MYRDWILRIKDALKSIEYISQDILGMSYDNFLENRTIRQATERNIELIGEALNAVPKEIQEEYKEIDWRNTIGMRNYIIHQYFDVVPDIEWEVATIHIVDLKEKLLKILKDYNSLS